MRSLKRALLAYILGGVSLAVLVAGLAVYVVARTNIRAQLDEALIDRANTFASLVNDEDGDLEFEYEQPLDEANVGVFVRVTTDDGSTLVQSSDWPTGDPSPSLSSFSADGMPMLRNTEFSDDRVPARIVAVKRTATRDAVSTPEGPARFSNRVIVVEVIGRTESARRAVSAVLLALVVGGVFAVLGSLTAVWVGIHRGLIPVRELSRAVDRIDTQELMLPGPRDAEPEELRPIVSAVEGLLERLRGAMERERRFTDAAAHELRTPIAELKTMTDVADRFPEPERLHRSIKDARIVVRQMEDLLECLLAAARGSTADGQQPVETVELIPAARALSEEATNRLHDPNVSWTFEGENGASWDGPPAVITAIIRNLVENAVEYTPEGGSICVRATANGHMSAFEVENGPVSIQADEVKHVFEPFWRADAARSDRNHRGLGLTIVESLAAAMKLDCQATLAPGDRLRIKLIARADADSPAATLPNMG